VLAPLKRTEVAIDALAMLAAEFPHTMLVVRGTERIAGGPQKSIEDRARALGIRDRLKILGFVDDIADVYAASDLIVHCANAEPFGMVVAEAMLMAKPVIAVDNCGPGEIVVDGETGRLVPVPGTAEEFAAAIAELLRDPARAAKMGEAGRARALALYGMDTFIRRMEELCLEVMS
jgi:glycosyltransferase involved in cell wall biosynthesis